MAQNNAVPTAEELQDLLLESPGFSEFLLGLTTISASLLGGETPMLCAITVELEDGPTTVASSTDAARVLDEKQYEFNDGPCLTALRTGQLVQIPDLYADDRWQGYAHAISGTPVRSMLAVPISTDSESGAALNCYSNELEAFDSHTVEAVQRHAESLSKILRLALRMHSTDPYPAALRSVLDSRAVVDAAISLIMVQNRCSRESAMKLLHLAARNSNQRLHDIARDMLAQSGDPEPNGESS